MDPTSPEKEIKRIERELDATNPRGGHPLRNRAKEMVVRLGSEATNHWMQF